MTAAVNLCRVVSVILVCFRNVIMEIGDCRMTPCVLWDDTDAIFVDDRERT